LVFAILALLNSLTAVLLWVPKEVLEMRQKDGELLDNPLNPLRDLRREKRRRSYARAAHLLVMIGLVGWICVA
jgi:hypothetical protein